MKLGRPVKLEVESNLALRARLNLDVRFSSTTLDVIASGTRRQVWARVDQAWYQPYSDLKKSLSTKEER